MATKIIRRKPKIFDDDGFVKDSKNWLRVTMYPALDAPIRAVHLYKTRAEFPTQYSFITKSRYRQSFAWPAEIAIRNELRIRVGQLNAIRFGIQLEDGSVEWRKIGDFPTFREQHVRRGDPDFVLMSRDWIPVIRPQRDDDDDVPF